MEEGDTIQKRRMALLFTPDEKEGFVRLETHAGPHDQRNEKARGEVGTDSEVVRNEAGKGGE